MRIAIEDACLSLREGNHGFGAGIVHHKQIIAKAHDTEENDGNATAHAEMNALRKASAVVGKNLNECRINGYAFLVPVIIG